MRSVFKKKLDCPKKTHKISLSHDWKFWINSQDMDKFNMRWLQNAIRQITQG